MAIPTTFAPIKTQDFTLTPLKVHKKFTFNQDDVATTGSGYHLIEGWYTRLLTPVGAPKALNDPKNNNDGTYKHIVWKHLDHLYYRYPDDPFATLEHWNPRYTHKFLNVSASLLAVPYMDYGERIKPGSVQITNPGLGITLIDDGYGNLYDADLEASMSAFNRNNVIGYWGFNEEFRNFKYNYGVMSQGKYHYDGYQFSTNNYPSSVNNVTYLAGPTISGSECGMSAVFQSTDLDYGYIRTPHNQAFNFDSLDEFTISFWMKPAYQTATASLISKNGVLFENTWGMQNKVLDSGQTTTALHMSSSHRDVATDVYPFDFTWHDDTLTFKRSDGIRDFTLTGSAASGSWNHVSVTRYFIGDTPYIRMMINGGETDVSASDGTEQPMNKHDIMFGARNQAGTDPYSGSLDEIRFINAATYSASAYDTNFYQGLANLDYMYNTAVCGNVFYRRGNIVLSPIYNKYADMFSGSFEMEYRGTHTIYQYEVLCRIRKGDFNLTMNTTALQSPKSDLLINELTGSLLKPYFTTIGMYNDKGHLMVVGKMGQPVQVRDDVDINIAVRFDG